MPSDEVTAQWILENLKEILVYCHGSPTRQTDYSLAASAWARVKPLADAEIGAERHQEILKIARGENLVRLPAGCSGCKHYDVENDNSPCNTCYTTGFHTAFERKEP